MCLLSSAARGLLTFFTVGFKRLHEKKSPQAMKELSSPLCPGYINGYFAFLSNFVSTDEQNLKFVLLKSIAFYLFSSTRLSRIVCYFHGKSYSDLSRIGPVHFRLKGCWLVFFNFIQITEP